MLVNIGKTIELEVDETKFNDEVMKHVFYMGIRNVLMDSHAGVNAKAQPNLSSQDVIDQSRAVAQKKLAALYRGEIRVAGTRASNVDPIENEMRRIALTLIHADMKKSGTKLSSRTTEDYQTMIKDLLEKKGESIRKVATKFVTDLKGL